MKPNGKSRFIYRSGTRFPDEPKILSISYCMLICSVGDVGINYSPVGIAMVILRSLVYSIC